MKVLYLHQYFVPGDGSGGTRSYEFARRLVADGHQVTLITSSAMLPETYQPDRNLAQIEMDGIQLVVIRVPYSNKMSFSRRILAFAQFALQASLQAIRHPADVIFATSTPITIVIPALAAKWRRQKPMVFEVRDLWPELPIAVGALGNPFLRFVAYQMAKTAYRTADRIICLSPGMAEGVQKHGISAEKIKVIPNSSDIALFENPPESSENIREQLNLTPDQPLIVYTGTLGYINGVDYLVRVAAAARDNNWDLNVLLVGDGVQRPQVQALAEELDLIGRRVWLWDPVPKTQVAHILKTATLATSVFVPLKEMWHNSANKFFDALAAGKPIAINYEGWQADLLREHQAGLVLPSDDVTAAARALYEALHDEAWLAQAQYAARTLAHTRFSRDKLYGDFVGVLQQAVESRQSR